MSLPTFRSKEVLRAGKLNRALVEVGAVAGVDAARAVAAELAAPYADAAAESAAAAAVDAAVAGSHATSAAAAAGTASAAGAEAGAVAGAAAAEPYADAAAASADAASGAATDAATEAAAAAASAGDAATDAAAASASASNAADSAASISGIVSTDVDTVYGAVIEDNAGRIRFQVTGDARTMLAGGTMLRAETDGSTVAPIGGVGTLTLSGDVVSLDAPSVTIAADEMALPATTSIGGVAIVQGNDVLFGLGVGPHVIAGLSLADGVFYGMFEDTRGTSSGSTAFSDDEIAGLDAWAAGWSANFIAKPHRLARPDAVALNHFIGAGESFMEAQNGGMTSTYMTGTSGAPYGNTYMVGESELPVDTNTNDWVPIGTAALNPLKGTTTSDNPTKYVMSDAEVVAAGYNPNRGESLGVAGLYTYRLLSDTAASGDMVWTNAGRSGATLEILQKGSVITNGSGVSLGYELWDRFPAMVSVVKGLATAATKPYRIAGVAFDIGRNNYTASANGAVAGCLFPGETERRIAAGTDTDFLALLRQFKADFSTEILPESGQAARPGWFAMQPGEQYTEDNAQLGVGEAYLRWAEEDDEVILVGPEYHVTDVNHLDFNGYRWIGCKWGQVVHKVLTLGQRWRPLSPLRIVWRGNTVLIAFHVPEPPLRTGIAYNQSTYAEINRSDMGFEVLVGGSAVSIDTVDFPDGTERVVRITLAATPSSAPVVKYAGESPASGNGCLRDSDSTVASFDYIYDGGVNLRPAANIAALVNEPYDMSNWCVAFHRVAEAG